MRKKILLFILAALVVVFASISFGDDQEILTVTFSGYSEIILDVDSLSFDYGYLSQAEFEAGIVSDPFTWTISEGKGDECGLYISSDGMTLNGLPIAETAEDFLFWRRTYGMNFFPTKAGEASTWFRVTSVPVRLGICTVADWATTPDGTLDGLLEFQLKADTPAYVLLDGEYEATIYLDLALT